MQYRYNENHLGKKLKSVLASNKIDRLHVGCGWDNFPKNWLNIGMFDEKVIKQGEIKKINGALVLNFDLNNVLPIQRSSVKHIYGSHFIEHFTLSEAQSLLKTFYNFMKPEGIIRLTTPDLELWINNYYNNNMEFFNKFYKLAPSKPNLKTKGQILVGQAYGWGHKWLYDFYSLRLLLEGVNFKNVGQKRHNESSINDITSVEPNSKLRKMETLYVEAMK